MAGKGCKTLTLQVGQGEILADTEIKGIKINSFSIKPSILEDIRNSDLVISHAGAGSCIDVLKVKKTLIVVINEDLMDNHQEELAKKLEKECYLFKSNCKDLVNIVRNLNTNSLITYEPSNTLIYAIHIDGLMGFYK